MDLLGVWCLIRNKGDQKQINNFKSILGKMDVAGESSRDAVICEMIYKPLGCQYCPNFKQGQRCTVDGLYDRTQHEIIGI